MHSRRTSFGGSPAKSLSSAPSGTFGSAPAGSNFGISPTKRFSAIGLHRGVEDVAPQAGPAASSSTANANRLAGPAASQSAFLGMDHYNNNRAEGVNAAPGGHLQGGALQSEHGGKLFGSLADERRRTSAKQARHLPNPTTGLVSLADEEASSNDFQRVIGQNRGRSQAWFNQLSGE